MPRVTIDSGSILDPLEVELDGRVYRAVSRSPVLLERVRELQASAGSLSEAEYTVRVLGLMFGVSPDEFREYDIEVLSAVSEQCVRYVGARKNPPAAEQSDGSLDSPPLPTCSPESSATPTS